ncbi:hypothetical protein ACIBL6_36805 [Streptomyces sp. NPDC050400]|uniref:hypothetical protein n=1 Tax=Streptomyces sp. NPDC050400 TaxID=3365610 RepID=UPI00378B9570
MSETDATLLAALIGAGAAIYVGMLAYKSTGRQPSENANAQRSHAVWDSLRGIYTEFVLTSKEIEQFSDLDFAGGANSRVSEVADKLNDLYVRMELEGPNGGTVLLAARSVIENLAELRLLASDYKRADVPAHVETFRIRLRDETRDLRTSTRLMQEEVRTELRRNAP